MRRAMNRVAIWQQTTMWCRGYEGRANFMRRAMNGAAIWQPTTIWCGGDESCRGEGEGRSSAGEKRSKPIKPGALLTNIPPGSSEPILERVFTCLQCTWEISVQASDGQLSHAGLRCMNCEQILQLRKGVLKEG